MQKSNIANSIANITKSSLHNVIAINSLRSSCITNDFAVSP